MIGNITVNSAGDGIRGRDFVAIKNVVIIINSQENGIKSNVTIKGGDISITSKGGSSNSQIKEDKQSGPGQGFVRGLGGLYIDWGLSCSRRKHRNGSIY